MKKLSVDLLKPDPQNPRTISDVQRAGLGASMYEFGDLSGIVFNETLGLLAAGHQRMENLRALGVREWQRVSDDEGAIVHPGTGERFKIRIVRWDETKHRLAEFVANNEAIQGSFTDLASAQLDALAAQADLEAQMHDLRLDVLAEELAPNEVVSPRRTLVDFDTKPKKRPAWILIATTEDVAAEIESELRGKYDGKEGVKIELSNVSGKAAAR